MFSFFKNEPEEKFEDEESLYLYLLPSPENGCSYEVLNEADLERKHKTGDFQEGCRLFKIEKEIKISFERVIHFD